VPAGLAPASTPPDPAAGSGRGRGSLKRYRRAASVETASLTRCRWGSFDRSGVDRMVIGIGAFGSDTESPGPFSRLRYP
jgi:hypothetical protein